MQEEVEGGRPRQVVIGDTGAQTGLEGLRVRAVWTSRRGRGPLLVGEYEGRVSPNPGPGERSRRGRGRGRGRGHSGEGGPPQNQPWRIVYDDGDEELGFFANGFSAFYSTKGSGKNSKLVARPLTWLGTSTPDWAEGMATPPHQAAAAAEVAPPLAEQQRQQQQQEKEEEEEEEDEQQQVEEEAQQKETEQQHHPNGPPKVLQQQAAEQEEDKQQRKKQQRIEQKNGGQAGQQEEQRVREQRQQRVKEQQQQQEQEQEQEEKEQQQQEDEQQQLEEPELTLRPAQHQQESGSAALPGAAHAHAAASAAASCEAAAASSSAKALLVQALVAAAAGGVVNGAGRSSGGEGEPRQVAGEEGRAQAAGPDAAIDAVLLQLTGTSAGIKAAAAALMERVEADADNGARRVVARIVERMERVAAGVARVHLLHLVDCLLSHARRPNAPAHVAHALPAMAGAGLTRMVALAASDDASRARVARTLDAWGRKGLLEASYLRLGYERLAALGHATAAAGAVESGASSGRQRAEKRRRSGGFDYRLARIILPAPPRVVTEAEIMPELAQRMAQAAAADVGREALAPPPSQSPGAVPAGSEHQLCCNLFGPAVEVVLLMDPFGGMAEDSAGSRSRAPGAPLLQQLLGDASLALQPRPDAAAALLPDPMQEALADSRVATWRDVLAPAEEERARAEAAAEQERLHAQHMAKQAQGGQQLLLQHPGQHEQAWLQPPQPMDATLLQQWGGPVQQQQQQQQQWPQQQAPGYEQQQQQQPVFWQEQQPQQGTLAPWRSSTPPDVAGASWREASVEGSGDDESWITNVPAAPQRDDAAELARGQGLASADTWVPANPYHESAPWSWQGAAPAGAAGVQPWEEYDPDAPPPLPPPEEVGGEEDGESPPPLPPGTPPPLPADDPAAAADAQPPPLPPEPYPGDAGVGGEGGDADMEDIGVEGGAGVGPHTTQAAVAPLHSMLPGSSAGAAVMAVPQPYEQPGPEQYHQPQPATLQQHHLHDHFQPVHQQQQHPQPYLQLHPQPQMQPQMQMQMQPHLQQQQQPQQMMMRPLLHPQPQLFVAQQIAAAQQHALVANMQHQHMIQLQRPPFQHLHPMQPHPQHQPHAPHAAFAPGPYNGMPVPPAGPPGPMLGVAPPQPPQGPVPPGPMGLPPPLARTPLPGVPPPARPPLH
ncbi:hypothetical protein Rsub_11258 [Raphidocelis subcapitata]|uniref:CID domain-containing protein n=1 Tax=Raphidocelis subcapitata TaxID=307507 RepID=A0A2V0PGN0_9CHLO|nr:hypothetical protein Rsub_11258 [Raphidocelis subcapitata]|eukprot:GBF98709.1 hypothetical protein Rsub_11258 [Raphidocelis subcapitata]